MRFKLEINDEEILEFVRQATIRACNTAEIQIGEPATTTVDGKSESNETSYSNVVNAFVNAAVTMKLRTYELKAVPGPKLGLKEFMEGKDAEGNGSS